MTIIKIYPSFHPGRNLIVKYVRNVSQTVIEKLECLNNQKPAIIMFIYIICTLKETINIFIN